MNEKLTFYSTRNIGRQEYLKNSLEEELGKDNINFVSASPREIGKEIHHFFSLYKNFPRSTLRNKINSSISGIISPLANGDWADLNQIIFYSIPNEMKDSLLRFTGKYPLDRKGISEFFTQYLDIPVFESYIFMPGHGTNTALLGDFTEQDFLPLVNEGYNIWIGRNKEKWQKDSSYRKL